MKENKMGVMPVGKLLITMSLPMMVSMLMQALYNVVDSIFVSSYAPGALTAVTLAFPIQTLIIAFASGAGVGMNALVSRFLGEKRPDEADKAAGCGVLLAICSYILFLLFGLFLARPFMYSHETAQTGAEVLDMGTQYLTIVCVFSFGVFTQIIFERLFQSTGRTMYSMIIQSTGAVINMILDPLMIFGYLGFHEMGVAGAAIATVIGQCTAAVLGAVLCFFKNPEVRLKLKNIFNVDRGLLKQMLLIGVPTTVMQAIGSVMSYTMDLILVSFEAATDVFGAYFKIQSFVCMPVFGLNAGMIPIISYNYGAKNRERITRTVRLAIILGEAITTVGFLAFQLIPGTLLGLFNPSPAMLALGVPALRIISIHFLLCGACIVIGSVFQALGNGIYSAIVSFMRQLVVLLPVAYLLSRTAGVHAIWWCFPIAEAASLTASLFLLARINNKVISKL